MVINKVSQKNKVRVSIIIMLMMLMIMSVSSLAWDGYPDTPYNELFDDENYIYQAIIKFKDEIRLEVSDTPFFTGYDIYNRIISSTGRYDYKLEDGNWVYEGKLGTGCAFDEILQSTHDIYTDSSLTDVFFSPPKQTILRPVLTQHPPLSLMTPQIVGIVPYLIGLLIALVAFWKAWQFLSKTLRKA